jgi:GT2 family glycosyltransferase
MRKCSPRSAYATSHATLSEQLRTAIQSPDFFLFLFPPARSFVLRMGRNAHWAGGNNGGMMCRSAASTTTLFWNNDAVPLPGTIAEYVRMARTMQRSAIGAVGCALQYPDGRLQVKRLESSCGLENKSSAVWGRLLTAVCYR